MVLATEVVQASAPTLSQAAPPEVPRLPARPAARPAYQRELQRDSTSSTLTAIWVSLAGGAARGKFLDCLTLTARSAVGPSQPMVWARQENIAAIWARASLCRPN